MKRLLLTALAASSLSLAACGGGTGSGAAPIPAPVQTTTPLQKATAVQSLSFRVPINISLPGTGTKTPVSSAKRSPKYVSPDTSALTLMIDGKALLDHTSLSVSGSNSGSDGATGQSASYTSTAVTDASGAGYYQVNATMDLLPGTHSVGVVLTSVDGFVLSEDQESYALNGGTNPAQAMVLKPVADSAFLCDWPNCTGGVGTPAADGTYTIVAFAADHMGDTIVQAPNTTVTPLANGPFSIVETDANNVVTIGNPGPYADAGTDENVHMGYNSTVPNGWNAGHTFTIKCNTTGSTTVAAVLGAGSPAHGVVSGFNYAAQIDTSKDPVDAANGTPFPVTQTAVWTTPGQVIGSIPTFQDFGNSLHVNCDAQMNLTIT